MAKAFNQIVGANSDFSESLMVLQNDAWKIVRASDFPRKEKQYVVVTRHAALVDYLCEIGLIKKDAKVIAHATEEKALESS